MILTDFLERNARLYPDETALVEINPSEEQDNAVTWREASLVASGRPDHPYRREMNWADFDRRANRFANLLLSRGIQKGTKVGMLLMNSLEFLPIYFGVLKAGCIVVPMNYRYASDEIAYCLDLADVEVLVFGPEFISRMDALYRPADTAITAQNADFSNKKGKDVSNDVQKIARVKSLFFVGKNAPDYAEECLTLMSYCSASAPPILVKDDDDAAIYFSSGTTGFPKAILHKHSGLVHAALCEQNHHQQTKDDVFLCIPPLYHTGAKMHWFGSLVSASKAVLLLGVKPEWILRTVTEEKCTIVWLLVPWAQDILDAIEAGKINLNDHLLDQWRLMHIGAQPVPPSLIRRWMKYFPHHQYDTNYGLSESLGPGCVHLGVENTSKVGAIGKAGYGWKTKIVDEQGNNVKSGEVGELCVQGPGVMIEYYKNPKATSDVLRNGWLFTGDMAKEDKDGFIYLVDRKKDVIISGGENIYPVQIEDHLRKMDAIKDVAVIGTPDKRLGEVTTAVIEVKEGAVLTADEVNQFCEELPRYKRPKQIIFADVPRNPTGKIEKPVLRQRYAGERLVEQESNS